MSGFGLGYEAAVDSVRSTPSIWVHHQGQDSDISTACDKQRSKRNRLDRESTQVDSQYTNAGRIILHISLDLFFPFEEDRDIY